MTAGLTPAFPREGAPAPHTGRTAGPVQDGPGADARGTFDLHGFLPYRLNRLAARVSKALAIVYQERFDLSVPQWRVLATLAGGAWGAAGDGGAGDAGRAADPEAPAAPTARDLAALTGLDKVSVSRALSGLVERGLVTRQPHLSDARALTLHLTRRGRRLFERIAPLALAWESAWLEPLAPGERAQLLGLLARLEGAVPGDSALTAIASTET